MSALCQKQTHALQQEQSVPEVAEIDVNPLRMQGKGECATAADALMLVGVSTPL
jgi:hypothetical protein